MDFFDLVIVGAGGIHGLSMLKTYRDVHPEASVLVLDKGGSIGGVWAEDRLYPGLHTNNHFQTFEYSEFPMSTEGFNIEDDHIPGDHVNDYLHNYVKHFHLGQYIRVNSEVVTATESGLHGWNLAISQWEESRCERYNITTKKLVVATGLTSEPSIPEFDGRKHFCGPIYHTSELAKAEKGLGTFSKVALLSGAKFSWDIAYTYASANIQVDWIIRESGHGPCWMTPNRLTPFKIIPEYLLQTRLISWLSPCIFEDGFTWIRNFFDRHWLGRKIVDIFFAKMQHGIEAINKYDSHPETAKLRPWDDVFFIGTNRGLLNYKTDFFELVRNGRIKIHIADISSLTRNTIHLSDGQTVEADVLICGTGWKDTPQLWLDTEKNVGLPGSASLGCPLYVDKADASILAKFPKLKKQPMAPRSRNIRDEKSQPSPEPYRLYRFMVPPEFVGLRTLAFSGALRSPATTIIAEAQALWITAFLDNCIPNLSSRNPEDIDRVKYETILHTQFAKWRYSRGFGARFPELWFDSLPYVDMLLKDIGVQNRRKKSWWAERFTPYMPADYVGMVEEYICMKRVLVH